MNTSVNETKLCPYCKNSKPLSEWSTSKFTPYCKQCWRKYNERHRLAHRLQSRANNRKSWNKNKDNYNLNRKRGGRTLYEILFEKQNGLCAICNNPEQSQKYKTLSVDHCHLTGSIRGLLCSNCNRALGLFKDNLLVLESAIKYLKTNEQ
jgi:hypothetical protein